MNGAFSGSAYGAAQKTDLVNRIISQYDAKAARGPVAIPTSDQDTLTFIGINKQCLEFCCAVATASGGTPKNYQSGTVGDPTKFRPGMGLYQPRTHAMLIVDIYWKNGSPTQFKLVE